MALTFYQTVNLDCRVGTGIAGYHIVYPFSGSYTGQTPGYAAIYSDAANSILTEIGQFPDQASAEAACLNHYNSLNPPPS